MLTAHSATRAPTGFATVDQLEGCVPAAHHYRWWRQQTGLDDDEYARRFVLYGANAIEVKLKPIVVLLFKEVITPFYIFQVFSVTVWYNGEIGSAANFGLKFVA